MAEQFAIVVPPPNKMAANLTYLFRLASLAGVITAIRLHLRRGEDVNAADADRRTPLLLAASKGRLEACHLLLDSGADPVLTDLDGKDAYETAVEHGHDAVAVLVLEHMEKLGAQPVSYAEAQVHGGGDQNHTNDQESGSRLEWEEASDSSPVPEHDESLIRSANSIQKAISDHTPVDQNEDWDDVAIDLPQAENLSANTQAKRISKHEVAIRKAANLEEIKIDAETRWALLKNLIMLGKERGYLTYAEINDHLPGEILDDEQIESFISLFNDMGIQVFDKAPNNDEELLWQQLRLPPRPEEVDVAVEAEAVLFSADAEFGRTTDPVRMYMREMGIKDLLTREGEIEIAKRIEDGLKNMVRAIVGARLKVTTCAR